jgi:hypothetical protein
MRRTPAGSGGGRRGPRLRPWLLAPALGGIALALALVVPTSVLARAKAAPTNVTEPEISGSAVVGQTLTTTTGTWTGNPTGYAFQWLHCPQDGGYGNGSNCDLVPGATSSSLVLQASDVGYRIRVRVTASNADGSGSVASNPTDEVKPAGNAPANTAEPKISGTPAVRQMLTASTGSWTNSPASYAFQWLHCPQSGGKSDGSDCPAIAGATASTLVLQSSDVGFRIRVRVTASNAGGSGSAASNPTAPVTSANTPVNTAPPTITGSPAIGQVLTATPGTWTGSLPITFSYKWQRCNSAGSGCLPISAPLSSTYTVISADVGVTLRVQVTATNAGGSVQAMSAPTGVVTSKPVPAGCPSGSGSLPATALAPPVRLLVDRQQAEPTAVSRHTPAVVIRYHVTACNGRPVAGALVYATALPYNQFSASTEATTGADGWARLELGVRSGFPASKSQRLLAIFVRARKPGGDLLGGISTRRLFSIRVVL